MRYLKEVCGFRDKFVYSNPMYTLAGELVANIANKSYDNLVRLDAFTIDVLYESYIQHSR
jgi:CubicO group peptidase (beta-lactamase class C family)